MVIRMDTIHAPQMTVKALSIMWLARLNAANCIEKLEEFNVLYKQAGMSINRRSGSIQVNVLNTNT